jgi:cytidylate kinase
MRSAAEMAQLIVTIDGPAASGKSAIARLLAGRIGAAFLDTGAMYRAVTLAAIQAGADLSDERQLLEVMDKTDFLFHDENGRMVVHIDRRDVTEQLRKDEVTENARNIASVAAIRARLVGLQRDFAAGCRKIVTEGRDQGTVAFPDADVKFFLTAGIDERARRRQAELSANGDKLSMDQVRSAISRRDESDRSRSVGPLRPSDNMIIIDTTSLAIEQVVEKLLQHVKKRCLKKD